MAIFYTSKVPLAKAASSAIEEALETELATDEIWGQTTQSLVSLSKNMIWMSTLARRVPELGILHKGGTVQ